MYVCVLEKNSEKVLQIMVTYRKDRRMGKSVELGELGDQARGRPVTFTFCILNFMFSFALFECFTMNIYSISPFNSQCKRQVNRSNAIKYMVCMTS